MTHSQIAAVLLATYEGVTDARYVSGPNFFGLECWELDGPKTEYQVTFLHSDRSVGARYFSTQAEAEEVARLDGGIRVDEIKCRVLVDNEGVILCHPKNK